MSQFEGGARLRTMDYERPTSDTYRYTELLKGDKIGKIPTYIYVYICFFMEETRVLLHTPIIIIHFGRQVRTVLH